MGSVDSNVGPLRGVAGHGVPRTPSGGPVAWLWGAASVRPGLQAAVMGNVCAFTFLLFMRSFLCPLFIHSVIQHKFAEDLLCSKHGCGAEDTSASEIKIPGLRELYVSRRRQTPINKNKDGI